MHASLMQGNVRKPSLVGAYRKEQNYIGRNDASHAITFIPPKPSCIPELMKNLILFAPLLFMHNLKLYIHSWMVMGV